MNIYLYGSNEEKQELKELYKNIFASELLIIDDLGTEVLSETKLSQLLTIINERSNDDLKHPRKMIISTNVMVEQLAARYDDRIASRIIGGFTKLQFGGDDLRLKK